MAPALVSLSSHPYVLMRASSVWRVRTHSHGPQVRGLLGFRSEFTTETRGTGVLNTSFHSYAPYKGGVTTGTFLTAIHFNTASLCAPDPLC